MRAEKAGSLAARHMASVPAAARAEASAEASGRTVVVGVRVDAQSRELLTWALVKVAQSGDRVLALHVLPNSSSGDPSSVLAIISSLNSVLAVYSGFCNLKQVDLQLKVCRGSSLRRALVREAAAAGAAHLVLGVGHGSSSSSVSIAKYCARKVPPGCAVAAVSNGKIAFESAAPSPQPSRSKEEARRGVRLKKHSAVLDAASNDNMFCLLPDRQGASAGVSTAAEESCSVCFEAPAGGDGCDGDREEYGDRTSSGEVPQESGNASESLRKEGQGSPAVRQAFTHQRKLSFSEKTRSSILHWAMRRPSKYPAAAAIHPDHKSFKDDKRSMGDGKGIWSTCNEGAPKFSSEMEALRDKYASVCRLFTYQELSAATDSFSAENVVGKGGNSFVYKGCFPDGRELAVKVLKQTEDTVKEFTMEIEIITSLSHKSIVSLMGFSFDNCNLFLVYDLLSNGSLDKHLHESDNNGGSVLGWGQRYKIAVGIAEALEYLHGGCGQAQPAIHRDVKSSNILLSKDFEPLLSDFGLATWGSSSSSSSLITCNNVAGTFGYLAPEYFLFGKVNEKIDVYAFGVVMLELLTGRRPISTECPKGQESLVVWAKPLLQNEKASQLLDPRVGIKYDAEQVEQMILATNLCTRRASKLRPKMSFVLKLLLGEEEVVKSARLQVKASEELEGLDEEVAHPIWSNIQSHISLALLDVEDDALSLGIESHSINHIISHGSLEAYLQGRCGFSSSFD